jgi:hypothetical protein
MATSLFYIKTEPIPLGTMFYFYGGAWLSPLPLNCFISPLYSDADMINPVGYWNEGASSSVSDVDSYVIIR